MGHLLRVAAKSSLQKICEYILIEIESSIMNFSCIVVLVTPK